MNKSKINLFWFSSKKGRARKLFFSQNTEQHKKSSKLAKIFQRTDILLFTCFLTSFNFSQHTKKQNFFIISSSRTHYWIIIIMRNECISCFFTYKKKPELCISRAREAIKPSVHPYIHNIVSWEPYTRRVMRGREHASAFSYSPSTDFFLIASACLSFFSSFTFFGGRNSEKKIFTAADSLNVCW